MSPQKIGSIILFLILCTISSRLFATELVLKDGRILRGKLAQASSLAETPEMTGADGISPAQEIVLIDDSLRRTFIPKRQIVKVDLEESGQTDEKIFLSQRVLHSGPGIRGVGSAINVQPFDAFGRRIYSLNTIKGRIDVIQAITELTPQWCKVEGVTHVWDMRIATSTIPSDTLHDILLKQTDPTKVEQQKKVARFYLQAERYDDALKALNDILASKPDDAELKEQISPIIRSVRQFSAQRLLKELKLRHEAGQHRLVYEKLNSFPSEDVSGEILQGVRDLLQDYDAKLNRRKKIVEAFATYLPQIQDPLLQKNAKPIVEEMQNELSINTLDRMAAFLQSLDDPDAKADEKIALAASGWVMGTNAAVTKLSAALSLYKVRQKVIAYLNESNKSEREKIVEYLRADESATPAMIAEVVAHMKPPLPTPEAVSDKTPGYYRVEVPCADMEKPFVYWIQLPPEYDPYKFYPTLVTLAPFHGGEEGMISWWSGEWKKEQRFGQAARNGYIVIAPQWADEDQNAYSYTDKEHAAVLYSLRDACRRFSIDSDRIFLSGHSIGGDAAWDMGLAHPDLWAGVIPISAVSEKYAMLYWKNAKYVPFYVVMGELDNGLTARNARDLDRYFPSSFPLTVVEYEGRGHDDFYDEIMRLFDWMGRCKRNFFPKDFECQTIRTFDNFFWWTEMSGYPEKSNLDPLNWSDRKGYRPFAVEGKIGTSNNVLVTTGASAITVWLAPEMINFNQNAIVKVNGRQLNKERKILPDIRTLLDDVYSRGDRQHPFWAKIEGTTGRTAGQ